MFILGETGAVTGTILLFAVSESDVETDEDVDIKSQLVSNRIEHIDTMGQKVEYVDDTLIQLIGIGSWIIFALWWLRYTN